MKKILLPLVLIIGVSIGAKSQITLAQQQDEFVTGTANPNTGIAIAPHNGPDFDYTVIVNDSGPNSNTHMVHIHDNQIPGSPFQTLGTFPNTFPGDDPDVAFGANPDIFYVVSNVAQTDIVVQEFYLTGLFSYQANPPSVIHYGTDTRNPNIDMNSRWEGVIVFEDNGRIYATPVPSPVANPGTPVPIAVGRQPDVAVHDDIDSYTVTFINSFGELEINTYSFSELAYNGTASNVIPWGPFPPQGNFRNPRIAAPHNKLYPNFPDFTVVVEDPPFISAYIHSQIGPVAGGINIVQVNDNPSTTCANNNSFPVVTYSFHPTCIGGDMEIVIAWASDYQLCPLQGGTTNKSSVLLKSLDLNSVPNNNSVFPCSYSALRYNEVNHFSNPGLFHQSRPAIVSEYDGDYEVNELNESITFYNQSNNQLYWKNRGAPNLPMYKEAKSDELPISFRNNSVDKTFTINTTSKLGGSVGMYNTLGQSIMIQKVNENQEEFIYNYASLSSGAYIITYQSGEILETWMISNF